MKRNDVNKTNDSLNLESKVALITGAGSGIGRETALLFADLGARIAVVDRDRVRVDETTGELQSRGAEAIPIESDVSDARAMEEACRLVEERWGRLDIVFANAGINGVWCPIEDMEPEEWDQTFDVNLRGTFLTVKYALPLLKKRGGSIIITSSANGNKIFNVTGATAYATSKAAQVAFAKKAALELARWKIRVNAILPGSIESDIFASTTLRNQDKIAIKVEYPDGKIPLNNDRPGSAEQVARLVAFLASDFSGHITGAEIIIDGGQSLVMG